MFVTHCAKLTYGWKKSSGSGCENQLRAPCKSLYVNHSESSALLISLVSICRTFFFFFLALGRRAGESNVLSSVTEAVRFRGVMIPSRDEPEAPTLGFFGVLGTAPIAVGMCLTGAPGAVSVGVVSVMLLSISLKSKSAFAISQPPTRARTRSRPSS